MQLLKHFDYGNAVKQAVKYVVLGKAVTIKKYIYAKSLNPNHPESSTFNRILHTPYKWLQVPNIYLVGKKEITNT
jgi:hypothetical protein